ncbi:MAG: Ig-like domain-containing protein, partial [Clostridia bacterium]|nr:Ig-like domain-containing protein [Clostridia bacterium]
MIRKILAMTMICCMLLGAACIPGVLAEEVPLTEEAAPAEAGGAPEDAAILPEGAEPSEAVAMSEVSETAEAPEAVAQTVETVAPKKVVIDQKSTVVVNIGTPVQLTVHFEPSNGAASLTWSSSSKKKAIVDGNGLVTGVAEGTATITVKTSNGKKATVKVKVVDPYKPTGVSLSQTGTVKVNKGETLQLGATLSPSSARSTLTWSSSSKKKATVDGNGLVTGVAEGTATITVKTS